MCFPFQFRNSQKFTAAEITAIVLWFFSPATHFRRPLTRIAHNARVSLGSDPQPISRN